MIGGDFWTGGLNYLESLLSAIQAHAGDRIQPVLFAGPGVSAASLDRLTPYLASSPLLDRAWDRGSWSRPGKMLSTLLLGRDPTIDRQLHQARVEVLFQHSTWLGHRFRFPTIAWIPDFQHLHRPDMFTTVERLKRSAGYELVTRTASALMVSSVDARRDCERFYPRTAGRVHAVPFTPRMDVAPSQVALQATRDKYRLPERYLFMPNQLWLHKNHLNVVSAMQRLAAEGRRPAIIACGNPQDYRQPDHPARVIQAIERSGLGDHLRFLGMVPRLDLACLLRLSSGLLNPSFFEGWSTTVEEAKAFGIPLVLSDIPVHREQSAGLQAEFFAADDPGKMADAIWSAWERFENPPTSQDRTLAAERHEAARARFAANMVHVAEFAAQAFQRLRGP
jgi:glycosyltransferase involved in cell wall biosynthesis